MSRRRKENRKIPSNKVGSVFVFFYKRGRSVVPTSIIRVLWALTISSVYISSIHTRMAKWPPPIRRWKCDLWSSIADERLVNQCHKKVSKTHVHRFLHERGWSSRRDGVVFKLLYLDIAEPYLNNNNEETFLTDLILQN